MGEDRQVPRTRSSIALIVFWLCSTILGFPLAFVCLSEIAADNHRWDAVVPLNLGQSSDWAEANLRTLHGGHFRVWLSTVGFEQADEGRLFAGRVEAVVRGPSGTERFAGVIGPGGSSLPKAVNSGWVELGDLEIPASWLQPWVLRARVAEPDAEFSTLQANVILRKLRTDTGMGGLMFYVLLFPGVALVLLSAVLGIVLFVRSRRWPAVVTLIASIPLWPLL